MVRCAGSGRGGKSIQKEEKHQDVSTNFVSRPPPPSGERATDTFHYPAQVGQKGGKKEKDPGGGTGP